MYILAILGIILSVYLMLAVNPSGFDLQYVSYYIDLSSVLFMAIIVVPILAAAGLLKDFNNSFKLTIGRKTAKCLKELKRAKSAVSLAMRSFLYAGAVSLLVECVRIGAKASEWSEAGQEYSVALLSLLYGFIGCLVLFPIHSRLEQKIADFMESGE
ncbi:MAG: hypothetical protein NC124_20100 [Clostridium sp.]|nr:hypothetical protein [Clostridium sp.]